MIDRPDWARKVQAGPALSHILRYLAAIGESGTRVSGNIGKKEHAWVLAASFLPQGVL